MMLKMGLCALCEHASNANGDRLTCAAFPDEIPDEILFGSFDHRNPAPGDNGITFTPSPSIPAGEVEAAIARRFPPEGDVGL